VHDDELGFDGLPIEAFPIPHNGEASAMVSPSPGGTGIAESFLATVMRTHQVVLDVHQAVSAHLLTAAGAAVTEHHAYSTPLEITSSRSEIEASREATAPQSVPDAPVRGARAPLRPQLPAGDMRMYGDELAFDGTPGEYQIGSILLNDLLVPQDAWFRAENHATLLNLAWLEIPLQAAGGLALRNGLSTAFPEDDFVCRNLEGRSRLLPHGSPLGRTLRIRSELLDYTPLHEALLLRFGFVVTLDGEPCCEGETLHGFFTPAALGRQQGLDGGRRVPTWLAQQRSPLETVKAVLPTGGDRLDLIDDADIVLDGGDHGAGYVLARKRIDPSAWYFEGHFPDDPVMPGSLGVEMLFQALRAYGIAAGLTDAMSEPCFAPASGSDLTWKYRGQVLRENNEIQGEVHVRAVQREPGRVLVHADGSLYCDGLRVYQVDGICIELRERRGR
jgi:3-hydroxymyristoyl/3-hydroxydecanoyl-(acyl carrier protein) dehydratase